MVKMLLIIWARQFSRWHFQYCGKWKQNMNKVFLLYRCHFIKLKLQLIGMGLLNFSTISCHIITLANKSGYYFGIEHMCTVEKCSNKMLMYFHSMWMSHIPIFEHSRCALTHTQKVILIEYKNQWNSHRECS